MTTGIVGGLPEPDPSELATWRYLEYGIPAAPSESTETDPAPR
ncbi:hypothetical protein SCB71_04755 [Herbiconiux sp. KACC 21604]|nr:hypothetical protein [Herbiconiux sp. SALV-R1]WPO87557.1 hypothetical protein SCB71_04755 [Herbiconiux sp. KACC 21604]